MLVHLWDYHLENTLCGQEIGRAGMTVERENANCEKCVELFDTFQTRSGLTSDEAIAALRKKLTGVEIESDTEVSVDYADGKVEVWTISAEKMAVLKEQTHILQYKLDHLQPCSDQLTLVIRLIKEL